MATDSEVIEQAARDGARPAPKLLVWEWADQYRMLPARAAAEHGEWRTERTPYLREIMECLSPTCSLERVSFMKGAQLGGTECGNNWIGYVIHHSPGPMMAVMPTVETAKRNSKQRIAPLIEETPVLRERVREARSRDAGNTILMKEFPGGVLIMTGANSAVGLRSMPARFLFFDEVDGYPGDIDDEGDPVNLAIARARTYTGRRKIFMCSTPKIKGRSRIEKSFEEGDQRYFNVPCPHCMEFQVLVIEQLRWENGNYSDVWYECLHCQGVIRNHHKAFMLPRGKWVATATGDGKTASFHLSSMYSPVGWMGWDEIAADSDSAEGDTEKRKVFVNTILGKTFTQTGVTPDANRLYERREDYPLNTAVSGVLFLTAGVDVHPDRLEVEVLGWGRKKQSWSIDYRVFDGNPDRDEVWEPLFAMLDESWYTIDGVPMQLARMAIDSGYLAPRIYEKVGTRRGSRVMVVKGDNRGHNLLSSPSPVEIGPGGRRINSGVKVWLVNSGRAKEELYRWLSSDAPILEEGQEYPVGYCHLPTAYGIEYFLQLTAEQLVTSKNKRGYEEQYWEKTRPRNEALDVRVYARAAAAAYGLDRFTEQTWLRLESALKVKRAAIQEAVSLPNTVPPETKVPANVPDGPVIAKALAAHTGPKRRVRFRYGG